MGNSTFIKTKLDEIYDDFVAQPAWHAHCYAHEYMRDHCQWVTGQLKEMGESSTELEEAYRAAETEFEKLLTDTKKSFMNPDNTGRMDELDGQFMRALEKSCQKLKEYYCPDVEYLEFCRPEEGGK